MSIVNYPFSIAVNMDHLPSSNSTPEAALNINAPWRRPNFWGLILGPIFLIAWLTIPGLAVTAADRLLGIWMLTILWWITEPIPIPATGLLAIALLFPAGHPPRPCTTGKTIGPSPDALVGFSEPTFFFLMGGMYLGLAMMRHGFDRRFALAVLCVLGHGQAHRHGYCSRSERASAVISMFISNTAATAIVFPIVIQILDLLEQGQVPTPSPSIVSRDRNSAPHSS